MKYKRILLKLSGEALAGDKGAGICPEILNTLSNEIKSLVEMGVELALVLGGGNIHRGVAGATIGMDRTTSDHMGMLATVINSLKFKIIGELELRRCFIRKKCKKLLSLISGEEQPDTLKRGVL